MKVQKKLLKCEKQILDESNRKSAEFSTESSCAVVAAVRRVALYKKLPCTITPDEVRAELLKSKC